MCRVTVVVAVATPAVPTIGMRICSGGVFGFSLNVIVKRWSNGFPKAVSRVELQRRGVAATGTVPQAEKTPESPGGLSIMTFNFTVWPGLAGEGAAAISLIVGAGLTSFAVFVVSSVVPPPLLTEI